MSKIMISRRITRTTCLTLLLGLAAIGIQAQRSTDGQTPLGLSPGAPSGSYPLSGFESVNLFNGNLNFQMPLLSIGGRGGTSFPITLHIDQKWTISKEVNPGHNAFYFGHSTWWSEDDGGSRTISSGRVRIRRGAWKWSGGLFYSLTRVTFIAPDGTEYELRDQKTGGQAVVPGGGSGFNREKIFVSADGTSATFISDSDIIDAYDYFDDEVAYPATGYLMLRDGTRFRIVDDKVMWMRDRNGNKVSFDYDFYKRVTSVTDSLNRHITVEYGLSSGNDLYDQINYKGFGGAARTVRIGHTNVGAALRGDIVVTQTPLFPGLTGVDNSNPPVISFIELPDGRRYQLQYNQYAEIARIVLPTGGAIEYDWAKGLTDGADSGLFTLAGDKYVYRRVVERRVYPDGGAGPNYETKTTYSRPEASTGALPNNILVEQTTPSGILLARSQHYFYGSARDSFGKKPTEYSGWQDSKEYKTETFETNGITILKQSDTTFQQPTAGLNWPLTQAETSAAAKPNNPQVTQTFITLFDTNQVTKRTFGYDLYNNQNNVKEYDTDSANTLLRETRTTYLANSDYTGTTVHLRSLPVQVSVYNGSGVEKARSTVEYDNYALDGADCSHSFHCPLKPRSNVSGFDSTFDANAIMRGNPTGSTHYQLVNGSVTGSISSYSQYDILGNMVRSIDPRSTPSNIIATTLEYDDCFGAPNGEARTPSAPSELAGLATFTLPTRVINALGHTTYAQFDYYLGKPVDGEDANGIVASGYYYDLLDRPTQVRRAVGTAAQNQTSFSYEDAYHQITSTSDQSNFNDPAPLKSQSLYDGMGRTIESRTFETSTDYIAVLQVPFFIEQDPDTLAWVPAAKSSKPFRSSVESPVWTTTFSDALGRVAKVRTPDGAIVRTSYSGNSVTVTDQAGKKRRSITDGLGRLTRVDEADGNNNLDLLGVPIQSTVYSYDTLDNLISVGQGGQSRSFVYDSLKRLTSAINPENGLTCYGTVSGGLCQANGYDANGNLIYKTDARGVLSTYSYDELNREKSVTYTNDPVNTPAVNRYYDGMRDGNFTNIPNVKGRLWQTETSGANGTRNTVNSYDAMGRPLSQSEQFAVSGVFGAAFTVQRAYDLAGHVKTQVYPSNNSVTYNYDAAGRLGDNGQNLAFTGNLGEGGSPRTYSRGITYSALGGLSQEQFGTDTSIYNKLAYNSRGQLAEIKESTAPNDSTWNRGKFVNWYSDACGGAGCNNTNNNGNLTKQETFIPNNEQNTSSTSWYQQYEYDSLNRLTEVHEHASNNSLLWHQSYTYDRYGNRSINQGGTTQGAGINSMQAAVVPNTITNRLYGPGETEQNHPLIEYDASGNQTKDSLTSNGTRVYDAENRMIIVKDASNNQIAAYTYSADGQRVRRNVNGQTEVWQVYGMDGELLAEYPANAAGSSPQKEYGYRNGQLLISAEAASGSVAPVFGDDFNDNSLDANKWTVSYPQGSPTVTEQSQQLQMALVPNTAAYNGVYSSSTYALTGKMVQVEVAQAVSQGGWAENFLQISLDANNYFLMSVGSGSLVLRSMVAGANNQTVISYDPIQHRHWRLRHDQNTNTINFETSTDGTIWTTRKTVAPGFSLTGLRFYLWAGAWGTGNGSPGTAKYDNFKLLASTQGSSSLPIPNFGFESPAVGANNFQYAPTGGSWTFAGGAGITGNNSGFTGGVAAPEGSQAAFLQGGNTSTISQSVAGFQAGTNYIITFGSVQRINCCNSGGQDFQVYLDSNLLGTFHPNTSGYFDYSTSTFTTTAGAHVVKFVGLNSLGGDHTAFIDNVRIQGSPAPGFGIEWIVTDQLGTPRMILDKTGALANVKRHDYLPFGEEMTASQGARTTVIGYGAADGVRQKFTDKERDAETSLDYFGARYYGSTQGRFSSADPIPVTKEAFLNPQRWNLYTYVNNNPLTSVDPNGGDGQSKGGDKVISVFLDLTVELGRRVTTIGARVIRDVPNASNWQGTAAGAPKDYALNMYGNPEVAGTKAQEITKQAFESSLANSNAVIYIGHGVQLLETPDEPIQIPFKQEGIKVGGNLYTPNGTGNPNEGPPSGPKPTVTAQVVANFPVTPTEPEALCLTLQVRTSLW